MIFFVTVLRALAAMLITNSHYVGVYPTDLIANGGLLGDVIFFAVSGFCLCNPKVNFFRWYGKRIVRIYPQVVLLTAFYLIIGVLSREEHTAFGWFVYPTNFHFIASIMLLYIPLYFLMRVPKLKAHLPAVLATVLLLQLIVYLAFVDKSTYNIDAVSKPFIRFLYAAAMLIGAYFRLHLDKYRNQNRVRNWILLFFAGGGYFTSKLLFSRYAASAPFQIFNQYILLFLLWMVFRCFAGIDGKLEALPAVIKKIITGISEITLEIYIVQIGIISFFAHLLPFPLNWLALTTVIVCGALLLHFVSGKLVSGGTYLVQKIKNRGK